jgi:hypothetical protein
MFRIGSHEVYAVGSGFTYLIGSQYLAAETGFWSYQARNKIELENV